MKIKQFKPSKKSQFKQGYYVPKNPDKYKGDPSKIIYRSGWERKFCIYCDKNENILEWSSEPFQITYLSKLDGETHRYFPDFYVKAKTNSGEVVEYVAEVKPKKYSVKPKPPKRKTKKKLRQFRNDTQRYVKNQCKWKAAKRACEEKNYKFIVITEDFINDKLRGR